ncbi:MAG: NUDIX hydrolase [Bifidobacteriaceae bacterium]|nr:NUDIX hydrolase [Bifidobacteriaceae bacterium]
MYQVVEAAGGIIYRLSSYDQTIPLENRIELCMVHRTKYDDWSWPKGKLEENESHRHAAVREITEETGIPVTLGVFLQEVTYPLHFEGKKIKPSLKKVTSMKRVQYWAAQELPEYQHKLRQETLGPITPAKPSEIQKVRWYSIKKSYDKLTHETDKKILDTFVAKLRAGQIFANCILLVRHAKAEPRKQWEGEESQRPLTPVGAGESYALMRELSCYNALTCISSPWMRCIQTLSPFTRHTGIPTQHAVELTEDSYKNDHQLPWRRFTQEFRPVENKGTTDTLNKEFVNSTLQSTIICTHKPVIGELLQQLQTLCYNKKLANELSSKSPYMPTGTAIALFYTYENQKVSIVDVQKVIPVVY